LFVLAATFSLTVNVLSLSGSLESTSVKSAGKETLPSVQTLHIKPVGYKPPAASVESNLGQEYYAESHCSACHSINNEGGVIGPMLDGIGQHRNSKWLEARLSGDPSAVAQFAQLTGHGVDDLPPHVRLPSDMTRPLVSYLLTLPEPKNGFLVTRHNAAVQEPSVVNLNYEPAPPSASSEEGKKLYAKFACAECHSIRMVGGFMGPTLDGIGAFHNREFLEGQVTDAQAQALTTDKFFELLPTSMPKYGVKPEEAKQIADYLMTLPSRPPASESKPAL
jgi:mono/diheme cytochrome c family protein